MDTGAAPKSSYIQWLGDADRARHIRPWDLHRRHLAPNRVDGVNIVDDPAATPTTSWILARPSISSVENVVRNALEETTEDDQLDDRPHDPITFDIPAAVASTYPGIRDVVEQSAERKEFDADRGSRDLRHLVRVLLAVTGRDVLHGSPYDVAEAMFHVARANEFGQYIRVCNLEHGLAQLPASWLMPDLPLSVGKIVRTQLRADRPLSRSAITERAGIATSTYYRRIGELEGFDFVERTDDRKWQAHLSRGSSRRGIAATPRSMSTGWGPRRTLGHP